MILPLTQVSSMSTGKASPGSEADLPEDPCKPDLSCPHQGRHELTGECCCCQRKTVGEVSYIKVEYLGRTVPENCLNDCVYEREGEEGGSRFCFAHGSLPVVCKDDQEAPEPVSMPVASPTPNSNPSDDEDLVVFTKPLPSFYKIETENWEEYKEIINISFDDPAEEEIRKIIFNRNIGSIKSNNELSENKQFITKFSHLTYNELIKLHTGDDNDKEIIEKRKPGTTKKRQLVLPKSFDWRAIAGAVRPVKNQGLCGSCWAFATTAAIETRHFLDTGNSVDLSEQQILDCTYPNRNGCGGGWYLNAYRKNLKQTTLKSYPYTGKGNEACKIPPSIEYVSSISGFNNNIRGEVAMKEALLSQGSLSVRMHVQETPSFVHYDFNKVYQYNGCDIKPNHVVVITGYGEDEDGTKFWIVKNSWGTNWALQGYFRILRGANMCGIEDWPAYPETPNPTGKETL